MLDAALTGDAAIVKLILDHGGSDQLATKNSMVSGLHVLGFRFCARCRMFLQEANTHAY